MSYDIRICVKVDGCDKFATIAEPECSSPTYNLRDMFVACMDWNYSTSDQDLHGDYFVKYYPCDYVIEKVERGIRELRFNRKEYEKFNPLNGWGDLDGAIECLESLRKCIFECAEEIPINYLYMAWV